MQQAAPSVRDLFIAAVELESPAARSAFLDRHCGDAELRRRIEEMLDVDAQGSDFLEAPAAMVTVTTAHDSRPGVEEPGTVIGPYKLLEAIGEGGMGTVYMAEQTEPVRRRVALKVIKPGMDSRQVVARFEAERQALAMMDHPNIAKVHDAGMTPSGRPYFVMELVRGLSITEYCDQHQLTIPERLELFVLVCRAVQHAHQKGVIHRDLKPSNVLVTVVDGVGVPKVIDFGVAKATGVALTDKTLFTGFHQFVGTPLYTSPEQAELSGADVDTRSDIYSLGVLLYELLTGTTPFDAETLGRAAFDEMRRIIREEEPPRPSTRLGTLGGRLSTVSAQRKADPKRLGSSLRGELDWVVMKALEKDRRRRYETASDFAADLMRYLTDRPVEAFPPSPWYRFTKFARRNRVTLTTGTVLALTLVAGAALSTWQATKAFRAERRAEARYDQARRVVDEMYTRVAREWLSQKGELTSLQRDFLEQALAFYEEFVRERHDDPDVQLAAVRARGRVVVLRRKLGRFDQAEALSRQSVEDLENLIARYPGRPEYQTELALRLGDLAGLLQKRGLLTEAEPLLNRATAVMESHVTRRPKDVECRAILGDTFRWQGVLFQQQGRNGEAEAVLRRSRDMVKELIAEWQHDRRGQLLTLANTDQALGIVLRVQGKLPEARDLYQEAASSVEAVLADHPKDPEARYFLALASCNLGTLRDTPEEALEDDTRAEALLSGLCEESGDVSASETLALVRRNLCKMYRAAGRVDEAEQVARRGVQEAERLVDEHPDVHVYRQNLVGLLFLLADCYTVRPGGPPEAPQRALVLAQKAVSLAPKDGMALQSLGWAQYRAGDWKGCIQTLNEGKDDGCSGFFLAMAHWRLGKPDEAREAYRRADEWLTGYEKRWNLQVYPPPSMLRVIRAEATALLGPVEDDDDSSPRASPGRPPEPQ